MAMNTDKLKLYYAICNRVTAKGLRYLAVMCESVAESGHSFAITVGAFIAGWFVWLLL